MKRRDLIQLLEANGWQLVRHGEKHDIWAKGDRWESVPRHREIDEQLARAIIRRQGLR